MKRTVLFFSTSLLALALNTSTGTFSNRNSLRRIDCQMVPLPPSARHHLHAPHIRIDEGTSLNWSGYAAVAGTLAAPTAGAATEVSGNWIVPKVTGSTTAYSSVWVGLDGYADGTVEQLGTEQDTTQRGHNYSTSYYTWFEMYPAGGYEIKFPTNPGDQIGAGVAYAGNNVFTLAITNYTRGVYYIVPASYTTTSKAGRSSAEWVVEAPSSGKVLPLADFGTAVLGECSATIGGVTGPISSFVNDPMTMATSSGTIKAAPSSLTLSPDGTTSAFSVAWDHN